MVKTKVASHSGLGALVSVLCRLEGGERQTKSSAITDPSKSKTICVANVCDAGHTVAWVAGHTAAWVAGREQRRNAAQPRVSVLRENSPWHVVYVAPHDCLHQRRATSARAERTPQENSQRNRSTGLRTNTATTQHIEELSSRETHHSCSAMSHAAIRDRSSHFVLPQRSVRNCNGVVGLAGSPLFINW